MSEHTSFISFGYRCSSAGILKRLGLKHESFPFDWVISRIPVIKDCIATNFAQFLNSSNYKTSNTCVASYDHDPMFVVHEHVHYNTHYIDISMSSYHTSNTLQLHRDTYAYPFAMNHHNIMEDGHYDYFKRCVSRFQTWMVTPPQPNQRKMFLYIHPALHLNEYSNDLLIELGEFQQWLSNHIGWKIEGLVFIPIKTLHPYPIDKSIPKFIEKITLFQNTYPELHAYKVYTNRDFIDAGEIFYRNPYIEGDAIVGLVNKYAHGQE